MPNITTYQYFNKPNELYLPLAVQQIVSSGATAAPNSQTEITNLITEIERDILLNSLGLTQYNFLQVALADLPNADQKWKDLVNGVEYDGKVWEGLNNDLSLLAYAVKYFYLNGNTQFITSVGVAVPQSENATTVNPAYKLVNCWNKFITKYQGGLRDCPEYYYKNGATVIDWIGSNANQIEVSLYRFLIDKKEDYEFDAGKFMVYENQNTFGI